MFLIFFLIGFANSQDFCVFFCQCGFRNVSCTNTPQFPSFENDFSIRALIIKDSSLSDIPSLERFASLKDIAFINTPNFECDEIQRLIDQGLTVHTDKLCFQDTTTNHELTSIHEESQLTTAAMNDVTEKTDLLAMTETFESQSTTIQAIVSTDEKLSAAVQLSITSIILVSISIFIFLTVVCLIILRIYKKHKYRQNRVQSIQINMYNSSSNIYRESQA